MFSIFIYTLEIAILSTLLAAVIGIPMAFFTARRRFLGRQLILSAAAIPLCVPPLVVALGYVSFWGMNGAVGKFLQLKFSFLYSTAGIIIAQGFYNFPFVTKIVSDSWEKIPAEQSNAAKLLGASEKRVFFTITLKQLSGAIAAACIPVFLFCFFSFMIVLLFAPAGHSTLEVELYHSVRSTLNVKNGMWIALLETLTAIFVVIIYTLIVRKNQVNATGVDYVPNYKKNIRHELWAFLPLAVLIILFFACPLISVLICGLPKFFELIKLSSFWKAVWNSLWVGVCTGILCTVISFVYAVLVRLNKKQGSAVLQTIPFIPMAISSVVISWLATLIFHQGNAVLLIILQTLLYWPIAYRQIQNGVNKIADETNDAAILLSKNKFDVVWRIYLPSCKYVIKSAFAFCFAISLGDSTIPLMLSIRNFNTLALYTYKLAASYRFSQACMCGGLVAILSIIIFSFVNIQNKRGNK